MGGGKKKRCGPRREDGGAGLRKLFVLLINEQGPAVERVWVVGGRWGEGGDKQD